MLNRRLFVALGMALALVGTGWLAALAESQQGETAAQPASKVSACCSGCSGCPSAKTCEGGSCPLAASDPGGKACPASQQANLVSTEVKEGDASEGEAESKVECPLSHGAVDKSVSTDYKGGQVYFCCGGCKAKFTKDSAKWSTQANRQLVASGQAKQVACPLTGRPASAEKKITVAGQEVGVCCGGCLGKLNSQDKEEQLETVFGDKGFDKAFKVPESSDSET